MGTVILTIWKVSLWLFWFFAAILYMRMSPFLSLGGSERPSQGLRPNTSARHYTWDKTSWALFLFACTPHILYFLYSAYGFRLDVQVTVHSFQYIHSTDSFLKFIMTFCAVFLCMDWTYIFVNIITHFRVDVQWFMLLFPFFKTYSTEVLPRFHFGYSLSAQKCNSAKKTRLRVRINF